MEVRNVIETLVLVVGLCGWIIYIPQFRLLFKTKSSSSNSLFVSIGGLVYQVIFFTGAYLQQNWAFVFSFGAGLIISVGMICLITYYRKYPGGRKVVKALPPRKLRMHQKLGSGSTIRRQSRSLARYAARMPTQSNLQSVPSR